jgi:hypothetical protein
VDLLNVKLLKKRLRVVRDDIAFVNQTRCSQALANAGQVFS